MTGSQFQLTANTGPPKGGLSIFLDRSYASSVDPKHAREFSWRWGQSIAYFFAGAIFTSLALLPLSYWASKKPGLLGWGAILIYEGLFLGPGIGFMLFRCRVIVDLDTRTVRREVCCAGFTVSSKSWPFSGFTAVEVRVEVAGTSLAGAGYLKTRTAEVRLIVGDRKDYVNLEMFFMPIRTDVPPEATVLAKELGAMLRVPVAAV
jgi:hypothetical protein